MGEFRITPCAIVSCMLVLFSHGFCLVRFQDTVKRLASHFDLSKTLLVDDTPDKCVYYKPSGRWTIVCERYVNLVPHAASTFFYQRFNALC